MQARTHVLVICPAPLEKNMHLPRRNERFSRVAVGFEDDFAVFGGYQSAQVKKLQAQFLE